MDRISICYNSKETKTGVCSMDKSNIDLSSELTMKVYGTKDCATLGIHLNNIVLSIRLESFALGQAVFEQVKSFLTQKPDWLEDISIVQIDTDIKIFANYVDETFTVFDKEAWPKNKMRIDATNGDTQITGIWNEEMY